MIALLAAPDREAIRAKHPTPALIGLIGTLLLLFRVKTVVRRHGYCATCYKNNSVQRRTNHLYPLRDGSEKTKPFAGRARQTMQSSLHMVGARRLRHRALNKERPRLFRAHHGAGERVASNKRSTNHQGQTKDKTIPANKVKPSQWFCRNAVKQPSRERLRMSCQCQMICALAAAITTEIIALCAYFMPATSQISI
jgi:hypothetical protein